MGKPYSYEDTIRKHDAAIYDWLANLHFDYGEVAGVERNNWPVNRVFAAPHRAIAHAGSTLVKLGWIDGSSEAIKRAISKADWQVLPLPFVTIDRDEPVFSPELAAPANSFSRVVDQATGEVMDLPYPNHMLVTYRVTGWFLKRYSQAHFLEWLYSQFGTNGAGPDETFLTVHHSYPFNDQFHSLRWIGTADRSDLEGENPRYIRSEVSLIFRMWMYRGNFATATRGQPVHDIQHQSPQGDYPATRGWVTSMNLFKRDTIPVSRIPTDWPKDGNATVEDAGDGLLMGVELSTDKVGVCTRMTALDTFGYQIMSLAATMEATGVPQLVLQDLTGDPSASPAPTVYDRWTLTGATGTFHEFALCAGTRFSLIVRGTGADATLDMEGIDVRQVYIQNQIVATTITDAGANWEYVWSGLTNHHPYLLVVVATGAATNVVFHNDATASTFSRTRATVAAGLGAAILVQPKTSTLKAVIPKTLTITSAYIMEFDAPYRGSTLLS